MLRSLWPMLRSLWGEIFEKKNMFNRLTIFLFTAFPTMLFWGCVRSITSMRSQTTSTTTKMYHYPAATASYLQEENIVLHKDHSWANGGESLSADNNTESRGYHTLYKGSKAHMGLTVDSRTTSYLLSVYDTRSLRRFLSKNSLRATRSLPRIFVSTQASGSWCSSTVRVLLLS